MFACSKNAAKVQQICDIHKPNFKKDQKGLCIYKTKAVILRRNIEKGNINMNLLEEVRCSIENFLLSERRFFFNEKDLQVNLALYLMSKYTVHLEYHVPKNELPQNGEHYPWSEKTLSIDIVVEKDGEYVPIELKYKTRSLPESAQIMRFGIPMDASTIIKNQSAHDIGRYAFWKDVRRLEQLNERFDKVVGGIAVFVTNDASYTATPHKQNVGYFDFRMSTGSVIGGELFWKDANGAKVSLKSDHPRPHFHLDGHYLFGEWKSYKCGNIEMYYNMIIVEKKYEP